MSSGMSGAKRDAFGWPALRQSQQTRKGAATGCDSVTNSVAFLANVGGWKLYPRRYQEQIYELTHNRELDSFDVARDT